MIRTSYIFAAMCYCAIMSLMHTIANTYHQPMDAGEYLFVAFITLMCLWAYQGAKELE
jgi:hypothetical protein